MDIDGCCSGGLLSEPAKQYPSLFGNVQFFKDFPYALPTFAGGFIGLTAAVISAVFVTEVCLSSPIELFES